MPSCPMVRDSRERYRAPEGVQYQAAQKTSQTERDAESEQISDI